MIYNYCMVTSWIEFFPDRVLGTTDLISNLLFCQGCLELLILLLPLPDVEIIRVYYHVWLMQCWGLNPGFCAYQATTVNSWAYSQFMNWFPPNALFESLSMSKECLFSSVTTKPCLISKASVGRKYSKEQYEMYIFRKDLAGRIQVNSVFFRVPPLSSALLLHLLILISGKRPH